MADLAPDEGIRVVLLGAPGSGKGTQAALLSENLGVPAISTGAILREAIAEGTTLGRRVEEAVAAGELVDDATMAGLIRERLERPDGQSGFILDGYPRTTPQAEQLEAILTESAVDLNAVVLIQVPLEEMVRRTVLRGRDDDTDAVVRRRQEVYEDETAPLIGYYRKRGLLHPVDGHQSIEDVHASILATLVVEA